MKRWGTVIAVAAAAVMLSDRPQRATVPSPLGSSSSAPASALQAGQGGQEGRGGPQTSIQELQLPAPVVTRGHEFYFTRAIYSGYRRGWGSRGGSWSIDYPKADRQFIIGLRRLTNIDAYRLENPVRLDDPELRRYPLLYALEVGYMSLTGEEVAGLRDYLLAGGFLIVDDFWGSYEWQNFESEMSRVLPGYPIVDIPMDHPLLSVFYEIDELVQVPNLRQGVEGGPTWEEDGYFPALRGIFDESGRLMVIINWNTDLGDAWEWADYPHYPLKFSKFAYQMGVNTIIYAMSH